MLALNMFCFSENFAKTYDVSLRLLFDPPGGSREISEMIRRSSSSTLDLHYFYRKQRFRPHKCDRIESSAPMVCVTERKNKLFFTFEKICNRWSQGGKGELQLAKGGAPMVRPLRPASWTRGLRLPTASLAVGRFCWLLHCSIGQT